MKSTMIQIFLFSLLLVLNVQAKSIFKRDLFRNNNIISDIFHKGGEMGKLSNNIFTTLFNADPIDTPDDGKNIDFGTSRKLDVYYDENDTKQLKPVVMFIHGGAWVYGSKDIYKNFGPTLRDNGYVGVIPDYVLFPFGKIDDMVKDVHAAIKWTHENIARYGGDPNNITISGHSAGSHLTMLTTLRADLGIENKNEILEPITYIKKLVLLNGPYDFDDYSLFKQLFDIEVEGGVAESLAVQLLAADMAAPTDILKEYNNQSIQNIFPEIVLFQSSNDMVVPQTSAEGLIEQFKRVVQNPNIRYIFKEGLYHNSVTVGIKADEQEYKDIYINLLRA